MINGNTEIIAHIGFPPHSFKAPMIYNPWFEEAGINAIVVPMGCQARDYPALLRSIFKLTNIRGADGRLQGDMFDGEGFVRGLKRKGFEPRGRRVLVVGTGGVGCAIAASLAAAGVLEMDLFDLYEEATRGLARRLLEHYP